MEDAMTRSDDPPAYPLLDPILETIANWVKRYRYAVGLRAELAHCGPDEVARVAHELGVGPGELVDLASRGPHAADQLQKMLVALGVDPKKVALQDPIAMRDLQRLCITCGSKRQCEHDLAAGTAAQNFRNYCPNAVMLDELFKAK
jgi:hypothetical protein